MAAEVRGFTDEEVMQPPPRTATDEEVLQPSQRGFTDADVMAPPTAPRGFTDEEVMQPPTPPGSANPGAIGRVWNAFRGAVAYPSETFRGFEEGVKEAWPRYTEAKPGEPSREIPLGWPEQTIPFLQKWGLARKGDETGPLAVARAADEVLFFRGAQALDAAMRSPEAIWRGLQGAGYAALTGAGASTPFARDIVSLPDAFMGSPHPPEVPPRVGRVLSQTEVREAIDHGPLDRTRHVPYEAGASKVDNTTHIDSSIPEVAVLRSGKTFDPTIPGKIHEQVEKFVMEKLTAGGMPDAEAYRVAHWEYAEVAEDAWYKSQGIDVAEAEAWWKERAGEIQHEPTANTPPDLYDKPYPHDSVSLARTEGSTATPRPTEEMIERANRIMDAGGIPAFHGTPHTFEKFDISKIGTGEGRQMFGYGLYFAQEKGIAVHYRDTLGDAYTVGGRPYDIDNPLHRAALRLYDAEQEYAGEENAAARARARAIKDTKYDLERDPGDTHLQEVLRHLESGKELPKVETPKGNLYRVRINADPEQFIDYDRPLSEQHQIVKDAFRQKMGASADDPKIAKIFPTAGDWATRTPEFAKEMLDAGIPGIKYYDAGSRRTGVGGQAEDVAIQTLDQLGGDRAKAIEEIQDRLDRAAKRPEEYQTKDPTLRDALDLLKSDWQDPRSRNYVMFDDKLIDITHRNGERLGNPLDLAKELGVIGPKPPLLSEAPPAQAARDAVPPRNLDGSPTRWC